MNAPRNRDADHAEVTRLIGVLSGLSADVTGAANTETHAQSATELRQTAIDLSFAADLLGAYAGGLALSTPDPVTGAFLVERYTVADGHPDTTETVLIWTEPESGMDDGPWLGYWDPLGWWFVDSTIATHVMYWARRPGVGQQ